MVPAQKRMTYAEYLVFEEASLEKHEFLDGEVYAMAGGTLEHGALAMAFGAALMKALGDRPCRVFSSDVRVHIRATGLTTYPDLSVACGRAEVDAEDPDALVNPVLLVEVLSDSTEAYDRAGRWELFEFERGAGCELASVDATVRVDDVYRDPLSGVA
ncbi:MAG TPA: Uma2 family endonuclease [Polyangiaceae bacterium]|jgi:Uma2 family endonuclease